MLPCHCIVLSKLIQEASLGEGDGKQHHTPTEGIQEYNVANKIHEKNQIY